jgi:acyl-CoA thioester hydrolase
MLDFQKKISIRWADIDANYHLRHSVYYDFGAQFRVELLHKYDVTIKDMEEKHYGPLLFREECIFKREIKMSDEISINFKLKSVTQDFSKYTIQHEFLNANNKICAVLTIDGAWIDTALRKLTSPPSAARNFLDVLPKTEDFKIL